MHKHRRPKKNTKCYVENTKISKSGITQADFIIYAAVLICILHVRSPTPKYTKQVAREKMVQWTNKAERCHNDVRKKLLDWGIYRDDREEIIGWLIEQNLINEQRYAEAFVHDKFEFNKWGAAKIEMHLKQKGISERNIRDALKTIPAENNAQMMDDIIQKRLSGLKGLQPYQKKVKIARYLISRGYESDLVWARLEKYV